MRSSGPEGPLIVVTVADPSLVADPELAARKNGLYAASIVRHGGRPLMLDERSPAEDRRRAWVDMAGLLLSGGSDLDPARYGRQAQGTTGVQPGRDSLEADAWSAAQARRLPVLGICRGLQAINVFSGGTLLQHVDGHQGRGYGQGPGHTHPLRLAPGSRLARILFPTNARGGTIEVNSYHHQAVRSIDLAPGLVASAWSSSAAGDLVEGLEAADDRFVIGVQCHPERTESTPAAFERLFGVFVDAARGPSSRR